MSDHYDPQLATQVAVLQTLVGKDGTNGIRGEVREAKAQIQEIDDKVDDVRAEVVELRSSLSDEKISELSDRLKRVDAWALGIIAALLVVGATIGAAIIAAG